MADLTNINVEVQDRCDGLTNSSTTKDVINAAIAARKLEIAGGTITRTALDVQIQRILNSVGSSNTFAELISLAASVPPPTIPTSSGKKFKKQEFNTSGNWVRPAGVEFVKVLIVGGGGGGGGYNAGSGETLYGITGSGGGGQVKKLIVDVRSIPVGSPVTVLIGAGGPGGTTAGTAGIVGGDSSFGEFVTALGGGAGAGFIRTTGSIAGVPRATSGGSSGGVLHQTYSVLIVPGLGGGAGSHASPGAYAQFYNSNGTQYLGETIQSIINGVAVPCGNGVAPLYQNSNTSTYFYRISTAPLPGRDLFGYGAGGGSHGSYLPIGGLFGAGGANNINASANSGGGGSAIVATSSTVGGNGGSGYCLVTWWE